MDLELFAIIYDTPEGKVKAKKAGSAWHLGYVSLYIGYLSS
jgi:hypothetical protein